MRPLRALIVDCFYSLRESNEKALISSLAIRVHSSLARDCEFRDNLQQHLHALVKRCERYPLIVAVHAL